MAVNVSAWAIRKPIPSLVLFTVLMVLGLVSFRSLPITRFPNLDIPIVQVLVTQSGAAPAELETQVTKRVEDAIGSVAGVKHIISSVADGASTTTIEFRLETNTDRALNDVKDALARIRADLPRGIDEPIVQRLNIAGLPILTYAAAAPTRSIESLSWYVDDVVARALQGVRGVGGVNRVGGVDREIRVALNPDRLLALGVSAAEVNRQLRATNVDLAGGRGEVGAQEQAIRTLAGARSLDALKATMIALPGGRKVRLDELGTVTDGAAEPRTFARFDGQPVVAFSVSRATGASDAVVAEQVAKKIEDLQRRNPEVALTLIDNSVAYTVGNYESAMHTLIEGALLAVLVVFIFLKDWRATLVSAVALPLSIIPTFWAMSALGFSLNLVSLLAITLVTGILVDDAIVEVENIVRHMRMGKSPYRAAMEAADEIGLAVIAITLTIVAVFAPVSFMSGIAGQYFKQFGMTVAVAVLFSLLVARLITPMMAAYFLRPHVHVEAEDGRVMRAYTRLVSWSVRWRWITVALGLALFAGSIWSTRFLPKGFLPAGDVSRSLFVVELPPGSPLSATQAVTDEIVRRLKARPEVRTVFVSGGTVFGGGGGGALEVRKASVVVNFVPKGQRTLTQRGLEAEIGRDLAALPDIRYWFLQDNGLRSFSLGVEGADGALVARVAAELAAQAKAVPLLANVVSTAALDRPEVHIRPKNDVAADLGVSTEALSETIRVATIGDVGANLAKFDAGDRLVPIRVQLEDGARGDVRLLESLRVGTARGAHVPLAAIAEIGIGQGPTSIARYDRARRVAVEADLVGDAPLGEAVAQVRALPAARNLPVGVALREAGDAEIMQDVFDAFAAAMGAGLMMMLGVLVLLFGSVLQPITILFSLPLSIGGVIIALLATNKAVSMPVVIGILMLMGVVTKNAIMLVDFAVEAMAHGVARTEAIVDAGRKRARPIIMTTIAMVAGMVPSALAFGEGGEFRSPMAIAVIGGLIVSTVLSLVFVPAVFTLMDDAGRLLGRLFGRLIGPGEEEPEPAPAPPQAAGTLPQAAPAEWARERPRLPLAAE